VVVGMAVDHLWRWSAEIAAHVAEAPRMCAMCALPDVSASLLLLSNHAQSEGALLYTFPRYRSVAYIGALDNRKMGCPAALADPAVHEFSGPF